MEICGACGYIHFAKDDIDRTIKSKVDLCNREFKRLLVGENLGSYYAEKTFDFGTTGEGGYIDSVHIIVCPNCGTIKLSGKDKEIIDTQSDVEETVDKVENNVYLCTYANYTYIVHASGSKDAQVKTAKQINKNMGYTYVTSTLINTTLMSEVIVLK